MYTKRNYSFRDTVIWSKKPLVYALGYSVLCTVAYFLCQKYLHFELSLPWQPIGVIGTAVAFYLGFKNSASYDRTWEARKNWGGIVNNSRTLGVAISAFIQGEGNEAIKKKIIYRHIAWLTAHRFQLRVAREWEHKEGAIHGVGYPSVSDKYFDKLGDELSLYLSKDEIALCLSKDNAATQLLNLQSIELQKLKDQGYIDDFRHMELHKLIGNLFDDQGRNERIKNFPFPRQYASAALWQLTIFSFLIPFGILNVFAQDKACYFWLAIPFSTLIIWVFFLTEMIGDYSENPFEGSYNDVPITSISRAIEIDLRQMIDDTDIPKPIKPHNGFLM
jgi:ion channel-forming bestrophin family protein